MNILFQIFTHTHTQDIEVFSVGCGQTSLKTTEKSSDHIVSKYKQSLEETTWRGIKPEFAVNHLFI